MVLERELAAEDAADADGPRASAEQQVRTMAILTLIASLAIGFAVLLLR